MDAARTAPEFDSIEFRRRLRVLCGEVQRLSGRGFSRIAFLREVSRRIFLHDAVGDFEVRLTDERMAYRWRCRRDSEDAEQYEISKSGEDAKWKDVNPEIESAVSTLSRHDDSEFGRTLVIEQPRSGPAGSARSGGVAFVSPLDVSEAARGVMILRLDIDRADDEAVRDAVSLFSQFLSAAIANRRSHFRLKERIKELTCLFGVSREVQSLDCPLRETLSRIVALLPPAWQYPEIAGATVQVRSIQCQVSDRSAARHVQSTPILLKGTELGVLEVFYCEDRPDFVEGAFLPEEQSLLESVAREVAHHVERMETADERRRLEEQLLHSDRLATIGQLAAGVAHEINQPLANILGFAQLIQKEKGLANQVWRDLQQIVDAALHGRDVVKNLLLFARQTPAACERLDLNRIIRESAAMVGKRCVEKDVRLSFDFRESCAPLSADPAQMKQLVINLVVNAIQAMPAGGVIQIQTKSVDGWVELIVADEGVGMAEETMNRIFEPFFTTKDVNEGTGLGLSVVHGIVTAHGGEIRVSSTPGRGTRFAVRLPVLNIQSAGAP